MGLEAYKQKQDFQNTGESSSTASEMIRSTHAAHAACRIYSIQKHHATHLHYDLRLEHEGVLLSWAIPKEPPKKTGVKRLVVMTEDHPIEYAHFQGEIPPGKYGAGRVELWDDGTYELLEYDKGKKLHVVINGKKLKGEYILIKFRHDNDKNWLFFKK